LNSLRAADRHSRAEKHILRDVDRGSGESNDEKDASEKGGDIGEGRGRRRRPTLVESASRRSFSLILRIARAIRKKISKPSTKKTSPVKPEDKDRDVSAKKRFRLEGRRELTGSEESL